MSDRTCVSLTVLQSQADRAEAIIKLRDPHYEKYDYHGDLCEFTFRGVNYGNLGWVGHLTDAGIAYIYRWGAGDAYGPGMRLAMFKPDGTLHSFNAEDLYRFINPDYLIYFIDDYEALKTQILDHKSKYEVLPWDNQEEYGKLYLVNQMLTN